MFWKISTVVLLLICAFLILYIWNPNDILHRTKKVDAKIWEESWVPFDFSSEGRQYVEAHLDNVRIDLRGMSGKITPERIGLIQKFFGSRGFIQTHELVTVKGLEISKYLKSATADIDRIDFELKGIYAEEYTDMLELPLDEQGIYDVLHHVRLDIQLKYYDKKGKIIDPEAGRGDRHIRDCTWR